MSPGYSRWLKLVCCGVALIGLGDDSVVPVIQANACQMAAVREADDRSLLVTRDLRVIQPAMVDEVSVDGFRLNDGAIYPWHSIVAAENLRDSSSLAAFPDLDRDVSARIRDFGHDWYLVRSRLERGESRGVAELLETLLDRYEQTDEASVGREVAESLLVQLWAERRDFNRAAGLWLKSETRRRTQPPTVPLPEAWNIWLPQYLPQGPPGEPSVEGPAGGAFAFQTHTPGALLPLDPILGLPLSAPPIDLQWEAATMAYSSGRTAPQATIYWAVAAVNAGEAEGLQRAELALSQSLADWNSSQRVVVQRIKQTVGRCRRDWADPSDSAGLTLVRSFLDREQAWLESWQPVVQPETLESELEKNASVMAGEVPVVDAIWERAAIEWELYLEGLYLKRQDNIEHRKAGELRLRWLAYAAQRERTPASNLSQWARQSLD